MRLLDTTTMMVSEDRRDIRSYAILSHTWGEGEVTFQDIANLDKARHKPGFAKIDGACNVAIRDGIKHIWIDTCCINKESSAELSEAINSMYNWYKDAQVCYAYLSDVPAEGDHEDPCSPFATSRWFTRGWTFQELIAPQRIVFYGKGWVDIGTKATLQKAISLITGIDTTVLLGGGHSASFKLDDIPVARRMSWAAKRNTTKEEDIAYSLMGVFGVNMPLLYGEGSNAFIRLQYEIIKKSTDHTIFAWTANDDGERGMLARTPNEFIESGKIERIFDFKDDHHTPYSITNKGLHIELPVVEVISQGGDRQTLASLNCRFTDDEKPNPITISLFRTEARIPSEYVRRNTKKLQSGIEPGWEAVTPAQKSALYIADDYSEDVYDSKGQLRMLLKLKVPAEYGKLQYLESEPSNCWERTVKDSDQWWTYTAQSRQHFSQGAVIMFDNLRKMDRFAVIIGSRELGDMMWCDIVPELITKPEEALSIFESYQGDGGSRWDRKNRFLDRSSADLADGSGWMAIITVSSGASRITVSEGQIEVFPLSAELEIKRPKQRTRVQPLGRPDGKVGYIIVPPIPQHGFTIDTDGFQTNSSNASLVKHLSCFVLYTDSSRAEAVPLKNSSSNEEFYLLVGPNLDVDEHISTGVEKERPENPKKALGTKGVSKDVYSVTLDQGRLVFVTIRRYEDVSVADYIINLSMG